MSKTSKYPEFQKELRERQAESQGIRKQIHKSSGDKRYCLWNEKRDYGSSTRLVLLTYACLRGVPYRVLEAKTHELLWGFSPAIVRQAEVYGHTLTEAQVKEWLQTELPKASEIEVAA